MMNRRSGQHLLLVLTALFWVPTVQAEEPPPVKVLLIATKTDHPWGSHMYMFDSQVLASCLNQTPGVEATVSLDWPKDPKMLVGVKSIVCFSRPGGELVLDPGRRPQFEKLMKEGVGYVAIHWATGIGYSKFAEDPEFTINEFLTFIFFLKFFSKFIVLSDIVICFERMTFIPSSKSCLLKGSFNN